MSSILHFPEQFRSKGLATDPGTSVRGETRGNNAVAIEALELDPLTDPCCSCPDHYDICPFCEDSMQWVNPREPQYVFCDTCGIVCNLQTETFFKVMPPRFRGCSPGGPERHISSAAPLHLPATHPTSDLSGKKVFSTANAGSVAAGPVPFQAIETRELETEEVRRLTFDREIDSLTARIVHDGRVVGLED